MQNDCLEGAKEMTIGKLTTVIILGVIMSLLAATAGCGTTITTGGGGPTVIGTGKLETRQMNYSDFTNVDVGYAFQVDITKVDSFFVSITMDDIVFEYLDIEKRGDTLYIGLEPNHSYRNITHRVIITMPKLRGLELSGASKGDISGFSSADYLQLELSGASYLDINDIKAGNARFNISGASTASGGIEIADGDFEVSGASTVELEGTAGDVSMDVSGASIVKLVDFIIDNADIELSGASKTTVNVIDRLDVNASGASKLYYIGNPTLNTIRTSGGSTISPK